MMKQSYIASEALRSELFKQLNAANPTSLTISILLASLLVYTQSDVIPLPQVAAWYIAILFVSFLRLVFMLRNGVADDPLIQRTGLRTDQVLILITSLIWGSSAILLFPPEDMVHQLILIIILAGLISGAIISLSSDRFCAMTFPVFVLSPLIGRMLLQGTEFSVHLGLALSLYLPFMVMNANRISQTLYENTVLRLEAAARESIILASEHRYRLLIEHAPIGIFHYDTNLVITFCNPCLVSMLNTTADRLIGLDLNRLQDRQVFPALKEALSGRIGNYQGLYSATFTSVERWIHMTCAPLANDAGKILGGIALIEEIGDRIQAERALVNAKELAEQAAQTKANFLANMSHEIRTPMNAIIGFSRLALEEKSPEILHRYLEKIHLSSSNLLGIINDILDISKIESGKLSIETAPFRLSQLIREVHAVTELSAEGSGLELEFIMEKGMPEYLIGDGLRLHQVLINLISNAIKFSNQGKVEIRGDVLSCREDDFVLRFQVTDTGIGLSEEQLDLLFKPFVQMDSSTTRKVGGTGLGLSICKHLVEMMGGEISVKSEPGQGSCFVFTVAVRRQAEPEVQPVIPDHAIPVTPPDLTGRRILVADDNRVNQLLMETILKKLGVTPLIVENGSEACRILQENPDIDLVLMDIQMPEMDGHQATREIRDRLGLTRLPIIAMTAHAMSEEHEKCLVSGMNGILTKPVDMDQMHQVLTRYLLNQEE